MARGVKGTGPYSRAKYKSSNPDKFFTWEVWLWLSIFLMWVVWGGVR